MGYGRLVDGRVLVRLQVDEGIFRDALGHGAFYIMVLATEDAHVCRRCESSWKHQGFGVMARWHTDGRHES